MSDRTLSGFTPSLPAVEPPGSGRANGAGPRWWRGSGFSGAPRRLPAAWYTGARAMLREAWRRHRTRRSLAGMSGHLLKDIGISYAEAEAEVNKPFWIA